MLKKNSYTYTLPYPPSVNKYWIRRGKSVILSQSARLYKEAVRYDIITQKKPPTPLKCPLSAIIKINPPDNRRRDIDNIFKGLFDSLEYAQVISDDNLIYKYYVVREEVIKNGRVIIKLKF